MLRHILWGSLVAFLPPAFAAPGGISSQPTAWVPSPLISAEEYKATIASVFGADIAIPGRFEPQTRAQGLLAVGATAASISADGLERYDTLARGIAAQVVDPKRRRTLFRCQPRNVGRSDDACARSFIAAAGRLLFRRPLEQDDLAANVRIAEQVANEKGDFYAGISAVLSKLLTSPQFLYRMKVAEPDPAHLGQFRLDSYSRAAVLSSYLWDEAPDDALLAAAEDGELMTSAGLQRQVDRMISSPSIEAGVRAFFSDMLGFDEFETVSKDAQFYPDFTPTVVEQAREQTLRTIVDHVVYRRRDYRDLFTTPDTFLTRHLAAVYGVFLVDRTENHEPDHWIPYTYPSGDPRAGLLAQIRFAALHSPSGRTSPTLRGKALRELVLCQNVPPPPGNVDFKFVTDTTNPKLKTTRARLTAHRTEPMCAGCHKLTDPIGLALENFDSDGGFRTTENGVSIDASGELNGVKFDGPAGLAKAVHDDPATTACVATRSFGYAAGRIPARNDPDWQRIQAQFRDSGYDLLALMRQIATSPLLYTVPAQNGAQQAAAQSTTGATK
jgi:hypothetical protein